MSLKKSRKDFLKNTALGMGTFISFYSPAYQPWSAADPTKGNIKISLNAYSFNSYLQQGRMDLDALIDYCSELNFDAVDPTGYYFPNYPNVPDDQYIYHIKRNAFIHGVGISGTGIRNNFADPDPAKRAADIMHIKEWIHVASKLGAPVIRVFAGRGIPEGYSRREINGWITESLKECTQYGREHGIMIGIQNHNDYLKNADHVLELLRLVDSEWLGIILDIGSFSTKDPYEDIARVAPHAVSWQIKEYLGYENRREKVDLKKIVDILREVDYRGYIPIETLGGDPMEKIPRFLNEVRMALG